MVEAAPGISSLPVVFFDGEVEKNIGHVSVFRGMDFKALRSILSRRIGISDRQFSIYLSETGTSSSSRRRIPVTSLSNFSAISSEKGRVFLVVLESFRLHGRPDPSTRTGLASNVTVLKRNDGHTHGRKRSDPVTFPSIGYPMEQLERRIRNLQTEEERYLTNMGRVNLNPVRKGKQDLVREINTNSSNLACEECSRGELGFHPCGFDPVVCWFGSSSAGPIARPEKRSM